MKLPLSWIYNYTDIRDISPEDFESAMTMSGSKVEGVETQGEGIDKVVTGKITAMEKHPDADRLKICTVDIGSEALQIVTGAPNVAVGDVIPVALVGARLPGGMQIKKSKLRGVDSFGMMCSTDELGLTEERATGVLILDPAAPIGEDIREVLGLTDSVVEFEITSNRPDCLSVIGLAREAAATFRRPFAVPKPKIEKETGKVEDYLKVRVQNPDLCPRYTARVCKNIKIGPSPRWLQRRLEGCGVRAINNLVDITNYVMLEYGQPMHAFDIRDLAGSEIVVKTAGDGETITTLDGQIRTLTHDTLVICDAEKPVAVAGVMGGENSEVKDDTATVVFESANFFGPSVRRTAQRIGLRTEASSRYEKGLDPGMTLDAVNRACQLVEQLDAGEVVAGIIDIDASSKQVHQIPFRPDKINAFLGTDIPEAEMLRILSSVEMPVENGQVLVPGFRADVEREADVAEEIARLYGYDKLPSTPLVGSTTVGMRTPAQNFARHTAETLIGLGFSEIATYSFTSPSRLDALRIPTDSPLRRQVVIRNPLGEETSVMRTTTLIGLLETMAVNFSRKVEKARFYELGRIYLPQEQGLPQEREIITLGLYGDCDFFDLKGAVEELLEALGLTHFEIEAERENPSYHPGKTAKITVDGQKIGVLGELHPEVLEAFDIKTPAFAAELDCALVMRYAKPQKNFTPLPKYPAVERDLAMLVDDTVPVRAIERVIEKAAGALLERLELFDVYRGEQIPSGKKSVAYSMFLRASDHTLREEETSAVIEKVLKSLEKELSAQLRD